VALGTENGNNTALVHSGVLIVLPRLPGASTEAGFRVYAVRSFELERIEDLCLSPAPLLCSVQRRNIRECVCLSAFALLFQSRPLSRCKILLFPVYVASRFDRTLLP
jgi:hypothetical protein